MFNKIFNTLFILLIFVFVSSCQHKQIEKMPDIKAFNHSFSNYDSINLEHIYLDLAVDFNKKELHGKAILEINNTSQCKFLILDTKQLSIEDVKLEDSVSTAWSLGEEDKILGQALVIELSSTTKKVAIYYHTSPDAEALMWLAPEQTLGGKYPFLFTQSQAILARTWVPCMDAPAVRFTYSADITCDKNYLPLMSASNNFKKNPEGRYHFEMPQPIPSYLLALAVGNIEFRRLGENCGVFAEPEMLEKAANEFVDLPKMIKAASGLYGDYAWGRYDILVLPPSFPFGGMENPRLTFATPTIIAGDKSLVSLVAHELAHSWSGNLVTNRTWDDFWLNEGFTVYFEDRIMEHIYGKKYADLLMQLSVGELHATLDDMMQSAPGDTKLKLNLKGRNPDDGVSDIAYVKGAMFLKYLENLYGRKVFDDFLNAYFNHFKWKTVTTEEFIEYFQNHMSKWPKVKPDLDEWIYQVGLPKNCPSIGSTEIKRLDEMVNKINQSKEVKLIDTTGFTTQHWMHLLRTLNADSITTIMTQIDTTYHLSESTNSEIQCDWYVLCIKNNYKAALPYMEQYLMTVGRRKFLIPIYEQLSATPEGLKLAQSIYNKAKKGYHSVSRNTIEEMLLKDTKH
ncbi:MAG: M1 family metallopeptidase [Bacteroidia bacterium]|nr:M1 family metallopeptidase [Bacteroidia bacterium]